MSRIKQGLLIVGCGDIALRAARLLRSQYRLIGLTRKTEAMPRMRAAGIKPVTGDLDDVASLQKIAGLATLVLHLAPPPGCGERDTRTANLLRALSNKPQIPLTKNSKGRILPQRFIYISTSGVYGDCAGAVVDETRQIHPQTARAQRRADAEAQVLAWGARHRVRVTILRVPGIYAADRLPLARLRQGTPALLPEEDGYTNHIHADDLARVIAAALRCPQHHAEGRIYNVCDDSEIKMGAYFDLVADQFNLPRPQRVSRNEAAERISPAMLSFMNESRRLSNVRMKRELRVALRYPTVAAGIAAAGRAIIGRR